jgi:hypothetical protein
MSGPNWDQILFAVLALRVRIGRVLTQVKAISASSGRNVWRLRGPDKRNLNRESKKRSPLTTVHYTGYYHHQRYSYHRHCWWRHGRRVCESEELP